MSISEFKAALGAGGLRPNQFLVTMNWPGAVGNPGGNQNFLISSASLPAANVDPTIIQYRGRDLKLAGERVFDPWTITVVNSTDMKIRSYFEKWSNLMNDYETNGGVTAPGGYMVDLIVDQLDRNDEIIRTYTLYNAWPSVVSEIGLSHNASNVISEFTVTLQYSHFLVALP